jgi:hypothetical protein
MGITKIISMDSNAYGGEALAQMIKISSRGLIGRDRTILEKRASAEFAHKAAKLELMPGEDLIHLLAMGSTECYGPNRNGDGFRAEICDGYHDTFRKYARWYRHHDNKDPKKGRGLVKLSGFNKPMQRIELAVALNATKEAADRNGGLVADEEIIKLANGEDIPVSMACRVSHDICSGCGNKARNRSEYCGPEKCATYGGLRDNIGKTYDDGHTLHADNPDPSFFDISGVFKPADRIAYVLGKAAQWEQGEQLLKAASPWEPMSGAKMAEELGVHAPPWMREDGPWTDRALVSRMKLAYDMASREDALGTTDANTQQTVMFAPEVRGRIEAMPNVGRQEKVAYAMRALADRQCLLTLPEWLEVVGNMSHEKAAAAAHQVGPRIPGVFTRLLNDPDFESKVTNNPYVAANVTARSMQHWAAKHASAMSLDRAMVVERIQRSVLRSVVPNGPRPLVKIATASPADKLASQYALYQLAFLEAQGVDADGDRLRDLVVRHNRVCPVKGY